jgi:hypothetical protein
MRFPRFSFAYVRNLNAWIFSLLAFLVPLTVRVLPEILMGRYIVGFDTVSYYVPVTLRWVNVGVGFFEFMAYAPLFYVLLVQLTFFGVPLTVSLKVLPPVLLGLLGLTIFVYAKKALSWSGWGSLSVSFFATLYFVGLRISWDMLRSELGLIFLFLFLTLLHEDLDKKSWKHFGLLSLMMALVVLSHQLVGMVMLAVLSVLIFQKVVRHEYFEGLNLILCSLPAVVLFGLTVYGHYVVLPSVGSAGWFSLFGFSSFFDAAVDTLGFLVYCFLPLLPFAFLGFRCFNNLELKTWLAWCLVAILFPIVSPYAVFPLSYRWILLVVFPLSFFVVEGLRRFNGRWRKVVLSGVSVLLSFSFVLLPAMFAFPYFRAFSYYVPSSMLQNSVPLSDCEDVVRALAWVNAGLGSDGVLLVHDAFHGWALLYLSDSNRVVCYGYGDPEVAAWELFETGVRRLFVVWWVSGEGWHGQASLSSRFVEVFCSGRIAVYEFSGNVAV